ncbi:tRNA adenosine(34) deaminase TadA [Pantoea sp. Aalb]|nr:tRNA adenosine(34) deaminase TadA [Pantoea sp. Aalb]
MHKALELANRALKQGEVPVGALLVQRNKVISRGWNQAISNNDPTCHAEIIAIRKGGKILKNYRLPDDITLYVTLEPCVMCIGAILHSRITKLVYGAKDKKIGTSSLLMNMMTHFGINYKIKVYNGILATECSKLLTDFFYIRRKENKVKNCILIKKN